MTCNKCGSTMEAHTVSETKRRGCLTILTYIVLLCIPIIGWIALFKLLSGSNKLKASTYFVCPSCGKRRKTA